MKDKEETKAKLISAVGIVLAEKGFSKIGVNEVARQAGVDKVLIYRYFSDLNGVMAAFASSSQFWPSVSELLGDDAEQLVLLNQPFANVFSEVFRRYANALRERPLTLEILSWETIERNALTIGLEDVREKMGLELMSRFAELNPPPADWPAIINLFTGGVHYLAIRGRKISNFNGMPIDEDHSWERLLDAVDALVANFSNSQKTNTIKVSS